MISTRDSTSPLSSLTQAMTKAPPTTNALPKTKAKTDTEPVNNEDELAPDALVVVGVLVAPEEVGVGVLAPLVI